MKILVTGSSGFIGKNLLQNLYLNDMNEVTTFESSDDINLLSIKIKDIVNHLKKSIKLVNNKNLNRFYNKYVFINK